MAVRWAYFKGIVLGAVVSTVVLTVATAFAGTGIGAVFNLGKTNEVNATTTLQGSSKKTLQLTNSGKGPALRLGVSAGQPPLTTNSAVTAKNLSADLLDGLDSTSFQANGVRIDAESMSFGTQRSWDIGPYITLIARCYTTPDGTNHFDQSLLNKAPATGEWAVDTMIAKGVNPGTASGHGGFIHSGNDDVVTEAADPSPSVFVGASNFATLIWTDNSGETITATYSAILYGQYCSIEGVLSRTT